MTTNNVENNILEKQPKFDYGMVLLLAILIVAAYFILGEDGFLSIELNFNFSFLKLPLILALSGWLLTYFLHLYFVGAAAELIGKLIIVMFLGIAASLVVGSEPTPVEYRAASVPLLLLTLAFLFYKLAAVFLVKRFLIQKVIFASILTATAFIIANTLLHILPNGRFDFEVSGLPVNLSAAFILFWSLIIMAAALLLSAFLSLSSSYYLSVAGHWFGSRLLAKFIFVLLLLLYPDIRLVLALITDTSFVYIEWLILAAVTLMAVVVIAGSLKKSASEALYSGWARHSQDSSIIKGDYLAQLAGHVEEFVNNGNKKMLVTYVTSEALAQGMTIEQASEVLNDLINYNDLSEAPFTSRLEQRKLKEVNRAMREKTVNEMAEQFEKTGGNFNVI
jgi:hypothetical protein